MRVEKRKWAGEKDIRRKYNKEKGGREIVDVVIDREVEGGKKKLMCSSDKDKIESFGRKLVVRVKPWRLSVWVAC